MRARKTISRRSNNHEVIGAEGLAPVIRRVLANRDIRSIDDLSFSNKDLLPPTGILNLDLAAEVICKHIVSESRIVLVGDYDADGATSCALGVLVLREMGAISVDYLVPDRFKLGYGLSAALVDIASDSEPSLLITVDNGIASLEGARKAREKGIDLVITDHHLPGDVLPDATVIVNPNLPGDSFQSKNLAGVGVIFYVLSAVRQHLKQVGWFKKRGIREPALATYLDLVALGTYADLVRLDHNNRILVAQGLRRINAGKCRPGIRALIDVSGRRAGRLVASDLGFQIAPRLNAAGRLEDMSIGIECLIENDPVRARQLADQLDAINRDRKSIEITMQQQALAAIAHEASLQPDSPVQGLCIYHKDWHEGIVGLVASRLKERRSVPAIAFAPSENGELKGSARSVPGVHIRDILCEIDALAPGLLLRFGGHAMAAGMTILEIDFDRFRESFLLALQHHDDSIRAASELLTDGPLQGEFDDLGFIHTLRTLAPWGQGFTEPLFDNTFRVIEQKLVGDIHLKMVLAPEGGSQRIEGIQFRFLEAAGAPCPEFSTIHAAYRVDLNEFAGRVRPQLIIEHFNPVAN
ncbi:MAG: single-stranded-DNA-specific exonuclease RecJ [marine bacterium B5-7]|nr:MAG: single-stranded-DNA-specific exonuclease RecJ [marine bacterium B5-7]